jgi:FixJ family two-component response regulator
MVTKKEFERIYPKQLTPKQHQVLDLFLQGKSKVNIMKTLGVKDREGLREIVDEHATEVLAEIVEKTGGKPFLTQFFCQDFVTQS